MRLARLLLSVLVLVVAAGCATVKSQPPHSEFEDIPVPKGLTYQPDKSTIIESPSVKAARLVYRGRLEPESLTRAMRATLGANGWKHVSTTSTSNAGTIQVYEKGGNALQVHIYEGLTTWFTYVELNATRAIQPPATPSQ